MKELNIFSDRLKPTYDSNKEGISFPDGNINFSNSNLMKKTYIKHTDCHLFLDYSFVYLKHTKHFIIYSHSVGA